MTLNTWGIDIGVGQIAIAFLPADHAQTLFMPPTLSKNDTARRLGLAYNEIALAAESWASDFPPLAVWVERPIGAHPNRMLDYMAAITQAAIYQALCTIFPYPVSVFEIAITEWKKLALGMGGASKTEVMDWALRQGYKPATQDEADALAIAKAGLDLSAG